jgi:hypothetical protein
MKAALLSLLFASIALGGLPEAKGEPNLERRAKLALENADATLTGARDAYARQDLERTASQLKEVEESIELAREALAETGKDPRRRPKAFKYGESRTRELIRRMDSLENAMDLDDRKLLEGAKAKLREVNEVWLLGIMTGHKKGDQ